LDLRSLTLGDLTCGDLAVELAKRCDGVIVTYIGPPGEKQNCYASVIAPNMGSLHAMIEVQGQATMQYAMKLLKAEAE
jgi:hypothetical protein